MLKISIHVSQKLKNRKHLSVSIWLYVSKQKDVKLVPIVPHRHLNYRHECVHCYNSDMKKL